MFKDGDVIRLWWIDSTLWVLAASVFVLGFRQMMMKKTQADVQETAIPHPQR